MAERSLRERAPLSEWAAESLRATAFLSIEAEVAADNWWRTLVGEDPETRVVSPRAGERREHGLFQGARLTLRIQPARIDWTLTPVPLETEPLGSLPTLGRFEEACGHFRALMGRWFPLTPRLDRLAFGAIALLPVLNHADGYSRLSPYLPAVKLDPEHSFDFLYRINRPILSRGNIPKLPINRLSAWSVALIEFHELTVGPRQASRVVRAEPAHACRVELDINTSPEFDQGFSPDQSAQVFEELMSLARQILEEGDHS